jgi:hypothetical protein
MIPQEKLERRLFNAPGGAEFFLVEFRFISHQTSPTTRRWWALPGTGV